MPHVSRVKLSEKVEQKLVETMDVVLSKLSKKEENYIFLLSLLTPTERLMLAKRLAIIIMLREGYPESHIALTLHVTRITVSRLSLFLEAHGEGFDLALKILEDEKSLTEVKSLLVKLAQYAVRAAGGRVKPTII